ncbi:MAG: hypothetical protein L6R19_15530 [Alphaproteobacteria bacterium]|nr:hypothetical protein [Alphaproteobacteria bacterium]
MTAACIKKALAGPAGLLLLIATGIGILAGVIEIGNDMRAWKLARGSYSEDRSLLDWRRQSGFETFRVTVRGVRLTMPKFFVTRAHRIGLADAPADEVRTVEFELRLPDFKPYGPASQEQYAKDAAGKLSIRLLTREEAAPPETLIAEAVASGHREHPNPVPDGNVHLSPRSKFEEWAYAYTKADGYRLFAICARDPAENLCTARFMLRPDVAVEYRFARTPHLARWPDIDAKLRALLESFVAT